jgi:glycosyl-4,4'-diaponeurosporenoate acyltransferase
MTVRVVHLPDAVTVVVDIVAWGLVHAGTGYAVHRLPVTRLGESRLYRRRAFEGERFYRRVLRVPRWKDRVPEAGALFAGGISKRALPDDELGGLERFVVETRRAELGHWLAAAAGPFFVLWNPWPAAVALVVYGVVANLPCIAIQRYNRLRAERVLASRAARSRTAGALRAARRTEEPGTSGSSIP